MVALAVMTAQGQVVTGPAWRQAVSSELARQGAAPEVVAFYQGRNFEPLWVRSIGPAWLLTHRRLRPEAAQFQAMVFSSGVVSPEETGRVKAGLEHASSGRYADLVRAEVALAHGLVVYASQAHRGSDALAFVDETLAPPSGAQAILSQAAAAPTLGEHLARLGEVNPIYAALSRGLAQYRAKWSGLPQVKIEAGPPLATGSNGPRVQRLRTRLGLAAPADAQRPFDAALARAVQDFQAAHGIAPTGRADPGTVEALNAGPAPYEAAIRLNMARARTFPPTTSRRFILVNVPAQTLWLYEDGKPKRSMRVVVGSRREQTPVMAGMISHAVLNPYWNIPVDMVRDGIAPRVLARGARYIEDANLEVLPDWSEEATPIEPLGVDWRAVAAGRHELRVRQRPGGDNMMGAIKFMMPNELGIYLHDTPDKALFGRAERAVSAGCVRVERPWELAEWLFGERPWAPSGLEHQVDLEQPTPVYIAYLTAGPTAGGVDFYPDPYGRDQAPLIAG